MNPTQLLLSYRSVTLPFHATQYEGASVALFTLPSLTQSFQHRPDREFSKLSKEHQSSIPVGFGSSGFTTICSYLLQSADPTFLHLILYLLLCFYHFRIHFSATFMPSFFQPVSSQIDNPPLITSSPLVPVLLHP